MIFFTCLLTLIAWISPAHSATIKSIDSDYVLISTENENWVVGDRLIARDNEGKAKAILKVTHIENNLAKTALVKGRVAINHTVVKWVPLQKRPTNPAPTKKISPKTIAPSAKRTKSSWGVTAGTSSNSMTVRPSATTTTTLSGTSGNISAFYQRLIDGDLSTRLLGGYNSLQAKGESSDLSTCALEGCKVDISYLGLEALIRYSFLRNQTWDLWVGGGLGFLFAINKNSNVLDTNKITINQTILFSLGLDWSINSNTFIPLQADYVQFPDNATSSTNQTIIRLGYGRYF